MTLEGTATEEQKDALIYTAVYIESDGAIKRAMLVSEVTVDEGVFCP
jgi:hypothetical protein